MTPVYIDIESFWTPSYSLNKIPTNEYVTDSKFEVISCATKIGDAPSVVDFGHADIAARFATIDWANAIFVAHNTEFDGLVAVKHFGVHAKKWACTMSMARPIVGFESGVSLKALAEHYGLQAKGSLEATETKGKRLAEFTEADREAMRAYNVVDTNLCAELFAIFTPQTRPQEMNLIDHTFRMWFYPQFKVYTPVLEQALDAERLRKNAVLAELAAQLDATKDAADPTEALRKICASAPKFTALIESLGGTVPTKISPTTGKSIPALAKTDTGVEELLNHPNPLIVAATTTRLDVRSTILESRLDRFIKAANATNGMMPICMQYYGANVTGRWSGTAALNQANLPRINPSNPKPSDALRKALTAPDGYRVAVADLSGIELRVNHFLWGERVSIAAFQQDREADLYKVFASSLYGVPVEEVTKTQRTVAKIAQLSLGYGSGWRTFRDMARQQDTILTEEEASQIVRKWRATYSNIANGWTRCDTALANLYATVVEAYPLDQYGLCHVVPEGIRLPRGIIRYPVLRQDFSKKDSFRAFDWMYGAGHNTRTIYGAMVVENIVQSLSRSILVDAMSAYHRTDHGKQYPIAHHVYDEIVTVPREEDAEAVLATMQTCLRASPKWWPELILWSEGDIAKSYGEAK